MIPVVNHKYKYILFYSAKVACSTIRHLFLDLHDDEITDEQRGKLNHYHNVNEVFPFDPLYNYRGYYGFTITRNPYDRIVSAYLDQYVVAERPGIRDMMERYPPPSGKPNNFVEFLEYLSTVPDIDRDSHFQTQYQLGIFGENGRKQIPGLLDYLGDLSKIKDHLSGAYARIFKKDPDKLALAQRLIGALGKRNLQYYALKEYPDVATMPVEAMRHEYGVPKPQDFFANATARQLTHEIYRDDFTQFGYSENALPEKKASEELRAVPNDFDWQTYLKLNPDLPREDIYSAMTVVRHYLEYGRHEEIPRSYKIEAPDGFDWQVYLQKNPDLPAAGIVAETEAIVHYLGYGIREGRKY